jgi:hypothetical protein
MNGNPALHYSDGTVQNLFSLGEFILCSLTDPSQNILSGLLFAVHAISLLLLWNKR